MSNYPIKKQNITIEFINDTKQFTLFEMPISLIYDIEQNENTELISIIEKCSNIPKEDILNLPYNTLKKLYDDIIKLTYGDTLNQDTDKKKVN